MRHLVLAMLVALLLVPNPVAGGGAATFVHLTTGSPNVLKVDASSSTLSATSIRVGTTTFGVAVDSKSGKIYATNFAIQGRLYVIDPAVIDPLTNSPVVHTVIVGKVPIGVALDKDGSRAYVANGGNGSLSVIDTSLVGTGRNPVIATVPGFGAPFGVAVSGQYVYVTNAFGAYAISVVDASTNTIIPEWRVPALGGKPGGVAVSRDGTRLFATNFSTNGDLWVFDLVNGRPSSTVATVKVGNSPLGVAATPDGKRAYVANSGFGSNIVSVVELDANGFWNESHRLTVGYRPHGVAISPNGANVYVANYDSHTLTLISNNNGGTPSVARSIDLGAGSYPVAFGHSVTEPSAISVAIDVVPNVVNRKARGTVPVIIFGSDPQGPAPFDVHTAAMGTVQLNGWSVELRGNDDPMANFGDFNHDGWEDVMVHIRMDGTAQAQAQSDGCAALLVGQTNEDPPTAFQGCDNDVKFNH